ncbi:S1 RNA-binding domain-containing protein [Streptomyces sp. V2I9]|uniref:S1 RNA-binding domain-containing protein n=1 Tax=Streptomyces sp. V2I9 TaxID=3042304 RepID=UPI00278B653F|nr:S1 RNA-binding domain-containing protein [Streptomyces sp. V2I9]MDQ0987760.1 ribosomal protein S1 [Streptomyces sp. V2I9]
MSSPGVRNSGRSCPVGVFVDIGDEVAGLVPFREIDGRPAASRAEAFEAGERIAVVVAHIDTPNRRVFLSRSECVPYAGVVPPT